jgi:DNA-binding transcriptional LysR family regulator
VIAPDMEIVRTFVRVADLASFTKAAAQLNRTQSTVSLHVKRMEEIYGRRLFERAGRTVGLTEDGRLLLSYTRRMLDLHEAAKSQLSERSVLGSARIGIPEDFATKQLPRVLRQFVVSNPGVQVEVRSAVSGELFRALADGDLDLLVARRAASSDEGVVVFREPLCWVAPLEQRMEEERPLQLVVFPHGCLYRPIVLSELDKAEIAWSITCTCTSLAGVQAAVAAGIGVSALALSTIPLELRRCEGNYLPHLPSTEIAIYKRRGMLPKCVDVLATFVQASFQSPLPNA